MTPFQKKCYQMLKKVPSGSVTTYAHLAKAMGHNKAYRAVGTAMKNNPNAPDVPCHRVVKSSGEVGEYLSGVDVKIDMLLSEGVGVRNNKVINFKQHLFQFKK